MSIIFDPAKDAWNRHHRGLPFTLVEDFEWRTSLIRLSPKQDVTATRFIAIGRILGLIHVAVFAFENDDTRVISLRRANAKERRLWLAAQTPS